MTVKVTTGELAPGPTGATGSQGPAGNGAVATSVDALSVNPRSVTDWTPILETAITGGARWFQFGPYDYQFATTLTIATEGLILKGAASGFTWGDPGAGVGRTRLVWNGTGSGHFIDAPHLLNGPVFEDLLFLYSSSSYTGQLVSLFMTSLPIVRRCTFGSVNPESVKTAQCALLLDGAVDDVIEYSQFRADFDTPVLGRIPAGSGGSGYSNVVRFYECLFSGGQTAAIMNPGLDWTLDHCTFEFPDLPNGKSMITTNFTYPNDVVQLTLRDIAWWDQGFTSTSKAVYGPTGNNWDFAAFNCKDHNGTDSLAALYDLQGNGSVVIVGGVTYNKINVGDGGIAGQQKKLVRIDGLDIGRTTDKNTLVGHTTAHLSVDVSTGSLPQQTGTSGQTVTLHHERALRVDEPTVVSHTGVLNQTLSVIGSDMCGIVIIQNTAGSTGPTGRVVDVTLAAPPDSPGFGASVNTHTEFPLVILTPFAPDDAGAWFATPSISATIACQPYAYVKTVGNSGSQSAFSIAVNVGIPASTSICVAYRVVHL